MVSLVHSILSNSVFIEYGKYLLPIFLYFVIKSAYQQLNPISEGNWFETKNEKFRPSKGHKKAGK